MLWRGALPGPAPPEPWPGRHEAFLTACAHYAAEREQAPVDVAQMVEAWLRAKAGNAPPEGWSK